MQKIEELISQNRLDEAIEELTKLTADGSCEVDDELLFTFGKLLWRAGRRSEAMEAYAKACEINPDSPAGVALQQAREIFQFFNPDLLNP